MGQPGPAATLPPPLATTASAPLPATATLAAPAPTSTRIVDQPPRPTATPEFDPFALDLPAASVGYAIPPAFQFVTENSAVLSFSLNSAAGGDVLYRSESEPLQTVPFGDDTSEHLLTLTGLSPGAAYAVLVALGSEPDYQLPLFGAGVDAGVWGPQTLSTPPYPDPLRFVSIADTGFGDPTTAALAELIAAEDPAFVLLPGDVVYRVEEQGDPAEAWRLKYFQPFAPVLRRAPIYPAVGNHELDAPGRLNGIPYYYRAFPPVFETTYPAWNGEPQRKWYSFVYSGIQFLSLNSQAMFGDEGRADQDAWLDERLADARYAYTVAFFHVPPFSSALHYADGRNVQPWADKFEAAGMPLVVSGHDHVYERLARGGTTYVVSGGGSATVYDLRVPSEHSQFFASVSHYTVFEAYPDRIEMTAVGLDGEIIDRATVAAGP